MLPQDREIDRGVGLLRQAYSILTRDVDGALSDGQPGLAIRRAQESVECAVKGALCILGWRAPEGHDIGRLKHALSFPFPVIGFPLRVALDAYVLVSPEPPGRPVGLDVTKFVRPSWTLIAAYPHADFTLPLMLRIDGSTIEVRSGVQTIGRSTDTTGFPNGVWIQAKVTDSERYVIQRYVSQLAKPRDAAFYLEKEFGGDNAIVPKTQAWTVSRVMLGAVGVKLARAGEDNR